MTNLAWTMIVMFVVPFTFALGALFGGGAKMSKIQELYDEIAILREKHDDPKGLVVERAEASTKEVLWAA